MKKFLTLYLMLTYLIIFSSVVFSQGREDAIWARTTTEDITLDGILDEASWAQAESLVIMYGQVSGLPTSGWRLEGGDSAAVTDPINATYKFLAKDNQLYIAFIMSDSSVGGQQWNATSGWDGILGNIKNADSPLRPEAGNTNRPAAFLEIMVSWLFTDSVANPVGSGPRYGYNGPFREERTPEDIAKWDAGVQVHGTSNEDSTPDTGWVVEMRLNLDSLGYSTTQPEGDILALNFGTWDVDWFTGIGTIPQSFSRAHWQSPWGNNLLFNQGRVFVRPDVTTTSGPVPEIEPDVVYPNMANFADPVMDGILDEDSWGSAYSFELAWSSDETVRSTYPSIGKIMSGQFQPALNSVRAPIIDPSHAEVKAFFKGTDLYLSAFVDDAVVRKPGSTNLDFVDGISFVIQNRTIVHPMGFWDNSVFTLYFDTLGVASPRDFLKTFVDSGWADYGVSLRGTTSVGDSSDIDEGYVAEIRIDLMGLGYSASLDDGLLFMGADIYDSDNFENPADDYGSRSWWFKENKDNGPLTWGVLSSTPVDVNDGDLTIIPNDLRLYGNYPNPFNPVTKISYSIPANGDVTISVYNVLGETVMSRFIPNQTTGIQEFNFAANSLSSGVYLYRIKLNSHSDNKVYESVVGKMILMK